MYYEMYVEIEGFKFVDVVEKYGYFFSSVMRILFMLILKSVSVVNIFLGIFRLRILVFFIVEEEDVDSDFV